MDRDDERTRIYRRGAPHPQGHPEIREQAKGGAIVLPAFIAAALLVGVLVSLVRYSYRLGYEDGEKRWSAEGEDVQRGIQELRETARACP